MDIHNHNRKAWNKEDGLTEWKTPVSSEDVQRAREGKAQLMLTSVCYVPESWYSPIKGKKILCLACGGGQQAPLFAAMGADVTLIDISDTQLKHDAMVAEREALSMNIIQGSMEDLSAFVDETFDLIFHPISNCYIADPQPVWEECYRVLKVGGKLLSGMVNPILYLFDFDAFDRGELIIANSIPYADITHLPKEQLQERIDNNDTLEFGHTLEMLLGGQTKAGFAIVDFYEDHSGSEQLDKFICSNLATCALKYK